jgi:hypothetical protein
MKKIVLNSLFAALLMCGVANAHNHDNDYQKHSAKRCYKKCVDRCESKCYDKNHRDIGMSAMDSI